MIDDYYDAESSIISHIGHCSCGWGAHWKKRSERSCPMIGEKRRYSPEGGVIP